MKDPDRIAHRRDPFEAQLRRAAREMVGDLGVERVIRLALGVYSRADLEAGAWLTARLSDIKDDAQRTRAFAAIARVALDAAAVEVLRRYEAGELPPAEEEAVRRWVDD